MDVNNQGKENNMHVMQVPTSPSFLKPKPIKLRKKSSQPKPSLPLNEVDTNRSDSCPYLIKTPFRTRNPFRRNEVKRKREVETDDDSNSLLWKRVFENPEEEKVLPTPVVPYMLDESALSSFADAFSTNVDKKVEKASVSAQTDLPIDWSIKTKVRFTSSVPFPNRGNFRTFEEVNGTIGFVRCLHSSETDKSSDVHSSHGSKFFQHSLVWMHPYLPWLKLFPRMNSSLSKQNSSFALDPATLEVLHSKWCDSFRSLYQLVRLYQCPYFYMCAPTFTLLFRCAGAASIPVLHAFISPTTKGFRKALREEGISFTMPLCENKDSESLTDDTVDLESTNLSLNVDKDLLEDPDSAEEDDPESWLENLGLSQDSINKKQTRRSDPSYIIDHKPESLVYVEDSETQGLVNFLLNSQFCTAKTGPMAGIPPTLLAPTAFLGGTLQPLQIRHGKVKQGEQELDSMEISGPLLPNMVHSLCSLFNHTQNGQVSSVLSTHSPTAPFSMVCPQSPSVPCIFAKNNMGDCGVPDSFLQQMCSKPAEGSLSRIDIKDGLFLWK